MKKINSIALIVIVFISISYNSFAQLREIEKTEIKLIDIEKYTHYRILARTVIINGKAVRDVILITSDERENEDITLTQEIKNGLNITPIDGYLEVRSIKYKGEILYIKYHLNGKYYGVFSYSWNGITFIKRKINKEGCFPH